MPMPIKPENKARYPENWDAISFTLRREAGFICQGSPDYPDCRAEQGKPHPVTGSKVVLTVGHLNHQPEDCRRENMRVWCQRCHLNYDRDHHAANAAETRRNKKAIRDLFDDETTV